VPTTLLTLPQTNLPHGAGFNSVPTPGPVALPANCASLTCTLTMSAADQANAANAVSWVVHVAPPGPAPSQPPPSDGTPGGGWTPIALEEWTGGTHTAHDGTTGVPNGVTFAEGVPARFQGGWAAASGQNVGATLRVGCTVTSNP
jgi:hypothetical protein